MFLKLLVLLFCFPVGATVFQRQSVQQQIKEADGIVIGHYLRSKSVRLENGSIATQMIFKMNKEMGMQSEFFGIDEVIVHYPGGKLNGETVKVEGVPSFVPGEKVVLMIKSHKDRYWGMNLGFGTFKVINYGNETMILNTLFPSDRSVGQMKLEEFERSVKKIKLSSLRTVVVPAYQSEEDRKDELRVPASIIEEGKNRAIASKTEEQENTKEPVFKTAWLIVLLAGLGGLFRLTRQKEAK